MRGMGHSSFALQRYTNAACEKKIYGTKKFFSRFFSEKRRFCQFRKILREQPRGASFDQNFAILWLKMAKKIKNRIL